VPNPLADNKVTLTAEVRRMSGIEAGQRLIAIPKGNGILLMPVEPASSIRGIAVGADPTDYRDRRP
jgi:bifunctional DNA-binding transcriptional regulator/antitoxin component of YhaV-PrlF toxin-antitoxin module